MSIVDALANLIANAIATFFTLVILPGIVLYLVLQLLVNFGTATFNLLMSIVSDMTSTFMEIIAKVE